MNKPDILSNTGEYSISLDDLPEKFHKLIYGAIYNLYTQGAEIIDPVTIDTYLSEFPAQYSSYNDNSGLDYLYKLQELGHPSNFKYYYERIKKYSFLRECVQNGIDVSDIYDYTIIDIEETEAQQQVFEEMSLSEMVKHIEEKVIEIKDKFVFNDGSQGSHMSEGVEEMLQELYENPSYGSTLSSGLLTRIVRGARRKTFMLRSAPTGAGKTRVALADLCTMCIPTIWDLEKREWIETDAQEKGLFITTELSKEEIQLPVLCYISGIPESKVLDADLNNEEKERFQKAVEILKTSPLHIEHLSDFDVDDIVHSIERNVVKHDVTAIVFDYIHMSMKLMTNLTKNAKINLREDQILLLMSDKIKQLTVKHDVWILSGTQLNDQWKQEGMLDASSLRGARALGDKLDVGMIMTELTKQDKDIVETIRKSGGEHSWGDEPTHVITVFKNRRGEYNGVRVFMKMDLGNLRMKDLFVTNMNGELIPEITPKKVVFKKEQSTEEVDKKLADPHNEDSLPDIFYESSPEEFNF